MCRWAFSIKMDPQEVGWGDIDSTDLALDGQKWRTLVKTVLKLRGP